MTGLLPRSEQYSHRHVLLSIYVTTGAGNRRLKALTCNSFGSVNRRMGAVGACSPAKKRALGGMPMAPPHEAAHRVATSLNVPGASGESVGFTASSVGAEY